MSIAGLESQSQSKVQKKILLEKEMQLLEQQLTDATSNAGSTATIDF